MRYLREGEQLYRGTTVTFTENATLPEDLAGLDSKMAQLSKLKENKRVLGMYPLKMLLYNLGDRGFDQFLDYAAEKEGTLSLSPLTAALPFFQPDSDLRNWLVNKAGEAPSLIDSGKIYETQIRMENYLYNRGFFYPKTAYEVNINEKKQQARVVYTVDPGRVYKINNVVYELEDPELSRIALMDTANSPLKPGKRFDVDYLKGERNRISRNLTDNGYLLFNNEYVYYEVDTTSGFEELDIYIKVSKPENDTIHRRYKIRDIYILPDAKMANARNNELDTLVYEELTRSGTSVRSTYKIVEDEHRYTEKSLANNVFLNSDDYYSTSKSNQTIGAFSNLGMFKYSTIQTIPIDSSGFLKYLDVVLKLEPLKKRDLTLELNTSTTSEYLFANYANASYSIRNQFKRLDLLRFSLDAGIESQISSSKVALNTSEFTAQASLLFPRFFWPFSIYTPKTYYPRTVSTVKLEYLNRVFFYTLFNTAFYYGSDRFEGTRKQQLSLFPIDVNYVRVPRRTAQFDSILDGNFLLKQSFQEQLILAPNVTYIYNSQAINNNIFDIYFRGKVELAGSLFYLGNALSSGRSVFSPPAAGEDPFTLLNLPFSNYTRLDLYFRSYYDFNSSNTLVGRLALGVAVPYWNSEVVPFVKQFYVGGANSIRAYPIRKVGPGAYLSYVVNEDGFAQPVLEDQTGDLKIEWNTEYRFEIIGALKGALFCDIGNVWTLQEDSFRPGSQFKFNEFLGEFAIGPGAGIRLDLSYFILRLDGAYPLRDPAIDGPLGKALRENEGVIFPDKVVNWNFAIGYPF